MLGAKTVELRRIRPRAQPGTLAVIYASSPVRAVLGTCVVEGIRTGSPDEVWELHNKGACVPRRDYRTYFVGSNRAVAITLGSPTRFRCPVPLAAVRSVVGASAPPQSFSYITQAQAARLGSHERAR